MLAAMVIHRDMNDHGSKQIAWITVAPGDAGTERMVSLIRLRTVGRLCHTVNAG